MKYLFLLLFSTSLMAERNISVNSGVHNTNTSTGNASFGTLGSSYPVIASGTYTPTITNVSNIAADTERVLQWMRVGNVVTVSGAFDVDPSLANTTTVGRITLPFSSANFSASTECGGGGVFNPATSENNAVYFSAESGQTFANFSFYTTASTNNTTVFVIFMCLVK